MPLVDIDGIFGQNTAAAVRAFQQTFDIPVTGEVDLETWDALYKTYIGFLETIPFKYIEGNVLPYPGVQLRLGSESDSVRVLQEYIGYISQFIESIPFVPVTGYYGTQTRDAVLALQAFLGIPQNGVVGANAWNEISSLYSDLYNGSRLNEGQYPGYEIGI